MSQPLLSQLSLWERHERRVLQVFAEALMLLRGKPGLLRSEVPLNRALYFCLLEANARLWRDRTGGFDHPPDPEGKNPPDAADERRAAREDKMPDFRWSFIDHAATDPRRGARHLIVECKRLGRLPRADWVLNDNYIHHGVLRFVHPEHGYAKGEVSAAMVGYIESMDPGIILKEVNAAAILSSIATITDPSAGWRVDGVSRLEQTVARPSPQVALALRHLWVDLRSCFAPPPSQPCGR
jgi:hypothetical protein